jgi:hypothetical protein
MRRTMLSVVAAGALAAVLMPSAANSQQQYFCVHGRGCVPMTPASHTACFNLAMQRGLNVSRGDSYNLQLFIYQCLAGRIPR